MEKPKILTDFLAAVGETLSEFQKYERPDVIAFGPATFTELKHRFHPIQPVDFERDSMYGIKYQVEGDIPLGEFRYMKWVTEGGERKLRVVKTIYVRRTSMDKVSTLRQPEPHPDPAIIDEMDTFPEAQ
jgi:hypothetical protein